MQTIKVDTISKPNKIKNCLDTTIKLALMASYALRLPKMINGMVKKLKKEIL